MFKQSTKDTINGWGQVLRWITPVLVTISLWIASDIKSELREVRQTAKEMRTESTVYNTNHLRHHVSFESKVCERISAIESLLRYKETTRK